LRNWAKSSLVLTGVAAFTIAALAAGSQDSGSGIRVQAYIGPTRPSMRIDEPAPPPTPFSTEIVILRAADRHEVARFTTDKRGQHTVRLEPGDYIVAQPANGHIRLPRADEQQVTVPPGQTVPVTISFDSGMR
jgi:hypothetical protein